MLKFGFSELRRQHGKKYILLLQIPEANLFLVYTEHIAQTPEQLRCARGASTVLTFEFSVGRNKEEP